MSRPEHQFWDWIKNEETGERILFLEGPIDQDDFWGDEVTPHNFREQLESGTGDITVWINSPGGNVFAAAEIYTMLLDYKGKVTVKIASIAASAASVVAMAGDSIEVSPTAMLMIHDPMTVAVGNVNDLEKTIAVLNEVKESIINAYQRKTGLTRNKIAKLMDGDGTWMNAKAALEYGFVDKILFMDDKDEDEDPAKEEEPDEGNEPGGDEDPNGNEPGEGEEPDKDDPGEEDDPDEEEKSSRKAGMKAWTELSRIAASVRSEYQAGQKRQNGATCDVVATYDVMLKQLEVLKNW